jgi:tRNA(Leu) C34 or U34 (ribose-2'-O)-methylase TrmL
MVPTRLCMNLAATVNVVLYDRLVKRTAKQARGDQ